MTYRTGSRGSLMLFSGRSHLELGSEIAQALDVKLAPRAAYDFANGEIFIRFDESVRGCEAFVVQSHGKTINHSVMEQLIMIDALKRGSAASITAILPYYPYARQDKKHRGREPISARLVADLMRYAGADRLVAVDLHSDQIQGFFDGPVDHVRAQRILTDYAGKKYGDRDLAVVSPDAGRVKSAERWANTLGGTPIAFIHKTRSVTTPNEVAANRIVGEVRGKTCILIDDMIDTGGTIAGASRLLLEEGADSVIIAATHGVLSGPAAERLSTSGAEEVILTNTLPISDAQSFPQLTVLSIADLLAETIEAIYERESVTKLFDGYA